MLYSYFFIVSLFFISANAQGKQHTLKYADISLNEAATNEYIKFSEKKIKVVKDVDFAVDLTANIITSDGTSVYSGKKVSICTDQKPEVSIARMLGFICPIRKGESNIPSAKYIQFSASDASAEQKIEQSNKFEVTAKIQTEKDLGGSLTKYTIATVKVQR